jgi:hypothetical protein
MGGKSSKNITVDIQNSVEFKNLMKVSNDVVTDIQTSIIQDTVQETSATTATEQKIKIFAKSKSGNINISGITQEVSVKVDLSIFQNTKMDSKVTTDITNQIQDKIFSMLQSIQDQASKQTEAISGQIGKFADSIGDVGAMMTGGSKSYNQNTNIKNFFTATNDVDIKTAIKNSVSTEIVNKSLQSVNSAFSAMQDFGVMVETESGNIDINNIKQTIIADQVLKAIQSCETSAEVVAKMLNTKVTDVTAASKSETTQSDTKEQKGLMDEVIPTAISEGIGANIKYIIIAVVIVAVLFVGWKIFGGKSQSSYPIQYQPQYQRQYGGLTDISSMIKNVLTDYETLSYILLIVNLLLIGKRITKQMLILILLVLLGAMNYNLLDKYSFNIMMAINALILVYVLYNNNHKEYFADKEIMTLPTSPVLFKINGEKPLYFGNNTECIIVKDTTGKELLREKSLMLTEDKTNALAIRFKPKDDKYLIHLDYKTYKKTDLKFNYFAKGLGIDYSNAIVLSKYSETPQYEFTIEKNENGTYSIKQGDEYISVSDEKCKQQIILGGNKLEFELEEYIEMPPQ